MTGEDREKKKVYGEEETGRGGTSSCSKRSMALVPEIPGYILKGASCLYNTYGHLTPCYIDDEAVISSCDDD